MFVSRLRTSLTSSAGLCAPASSSLRRRLAAALPALISINNSANRSGPRPSRFFALRAVFAVTRFTRRDPLRQTRWRRRRASNSRSRSRRRVRDRPLHLFYRSGYGQKQQLVPKRDRWFESRFLQRQVRRTPAQTGEVPSDLEVGRYWDLAATERGP